MIKVKKGDGRALRCWEELCLMVCGGELQEVVSRGKSLTFRLCAVAIGGFHRFSRPVPDMSSSMLTLCAAERDHILGISYSPRLYTAHISIWTKKGNNKKSIEALQKTILSRLSEDLRPASEEEYYYKKHSDHEGFGDAVKGVPTQGALEKIAGSQS